MGCDGQAAIISRTNDQGAFSSKPKITKKFESPNKKQDLNEKLSRAESKLIALS